MVLYVTGYPPAAFKGEESSWLLTNYTRRHGSRENGLILFFSFDKRFEKMTQKDQA
jgi:hypothetical protein